MACVGIRDFVSSGSQFLVGGCLSCLGKDPSTNMLAAEGDLLVLAIRSGNADVVRMLWDHCKANFISTDCTAEDFDAMIDVFFEVANDWEGAYRNTAVLGVMDVIERELNDMDTQMQATLKAQCEAQASTDTPINLTPRSSGRSSEGLSRASRDVGSCERQERATSSDEACFLEVKCADGFDSFTEPLPIRVQCNGGGIQQ